MGKNQIKEWTDEGIEHERHRDFRAKKHDAGCTCGYCELKRMKKKGAGK